MDDPDESTARNRPHVVLHVAVSVDGSTAGFEPDVGRYDELAATWHEDVTLPGADPTWPRSLRAGAELPGPAATGPTLAVVDGRGRVGAWQSLLDAGYWSAVVGVLSAATPPRHHGFAGIVTRNDLVDLPAMLLAMRTQYGARVVRVDSGGALNGALLDAGLVDGVSLLVHPEPAASADGRSWHFGGRTTGTAMTLMTSETLSGGHLWLSHRARADAR